ncbi:DUF6049 family protein [Actinomadura sp. 9N407]|uniref:DUF6049 family protein n=1 Tax=Actinomadura sp. 9N407 TaxID=3375154 RepID=UPI0037BBF639
MRTVLSAAAVTALLACFTVGPVPTASATPALPAAPVQPAAAAAQPENPRPGRGTGQSQSKSQLSLVLTKVTPKAAEATGGKSKITVAGTVQNTSGQALPGVTVRLKTSAQRMSSRTQVAEYATGQPSSLRGFADDQQLPQAGVAGGKASFSLSTTTATIGLQTFGVYPIGVEAVTQTGQVLAGLNTFITFVPKQRTFKPLSVAWVWPLMGRQHRSTDDTFLDDDLAAEIKADGRLSGLVSAAAGTRTPVTWSIDPALLDDVQTMANGPYTVQAPRAEKSVRKPKSTDAANWLNALRSASKSDPYFAVPYADPDAVALVRHKMTNHLAIAYANAGVAGQVLGTQPNAQVAWPPSGMAGQGTLNQMAKLGRLGNNGSFLMSSAAFADPAQGYTPSATTALPTEEGTKRTVVYDETLNKIVSAGTRTPGAAVLTEQRFLAETAMITAEAPELARSLVIAPDRRWNPAPAMAKSLLTYTQGAAWMQETPLDKIANAEPQQRVFRGYPDSMEAYELGEPFLDEVARISRSAARFTSVMYEPIRMNYRRAVLRMESSAWRGKSRYRRAVLARQSLDERLKDDMGRVRIIIGDTKRVTLAGSSGRIPITVANDLPNQSIQVRLEVVPENTARLQIGRLEDQDDLITLAPGQKQPSFIPVRSAGNGDVRLHLRLKSADDREFGAEQVITVRTTGYGRLALLITGGGLAVLFVGVGVRAMRARRRRKAEAAGDGSTGVEPAATGPAGPGSPAAGEPAGPGPAGGDGPAGAGAADFQPPTWTDASGPPGAGPGPAGAGAAGPGAAAMAAESAESATGSGAAHEAAPGATAGAAPGPGAEPVPESDAESGAGAGWSSGGRHRSGDAG